MTQDLDTKKIIRNAYRITSDRHHTCLRVRTPGGHLDAQFLSVIQQIAQVYGNGTVHVTTRQGFEVPGISYESMPKVNKLLRPLIEGIEVSAGVEWDNLESGYPAAGTRNVSACIGNRVCQFANYDTTTLAAKIESTIFPNHYHVKIAATGCPNDCIKAHMQDFGIIGQALVEIDSSRCIGCEACARNCLKRVTGAISMKNKKAVRDERRCLGCGECVLKCPTLAWTRRPEKYFRLVVLGRTGKKNPRLAATFLEWTTEEAILQVIRNTYGFIEAHIDKTLPKEHLGYIVDRVGYHTFRDVVLAGVELGPKSRVAESLQFAGYWYERDGGLRRA